MMEASDSSSKLQRLIDTVRRLHAPLPDGCPWCVEQTHASLTDDLIKEAYEVADAVTDPAALAGELGDVLLLVATHAHLASVAGTFTFDDVINGVTDKVIRRHPHVFGDVQLTTSDEVIRQWDVIKRDEGAAKSILEGIPRMLPSVMRADEIQQRVARVGFEWPDVTGVLAKVHEEVDELVAAAPGPDQTEEFGDLLFSLINLSRHLHISADDALQAANAKFTRRFRFIEDTCRQRGVRPEDLTLTELDAIWDAAKATEHGGA